MWMMRGNTETPQSHFILKYWSQIIIKKTVTATITIITTKSAMTKIQRILMMIGVDGDTITITIAVSLNLYGEDIFKW